MNKTVYQNRIDMTLNHHELVQYKTHPGMTIECKQGIVWVTAPGDIHDYVLLPGQRYVPQTTGKVMIEAMRDSALSFTNN